MADNLYLFRTLRAAGVSRPQIRRLVEQDRATRISRGVYGSGSADRLREIRALLARLPEGTVLGHRTAAALYGFGSDFDLGPVLDEPLHVILPVGAARPRVRGVVCHEAVVPVAAPVPFAGLPCAPPARCAIDLARTLRRFDGLAALDSALRARACTPDDLVVELAHHEGLRGIRQARELVRMSDGRAECAQESHLRLVVVDGGLPPPEPQLWVYDAAGRPTCRLDLGYRERRVGIEYDGQSHLTAARLNADRARMNWLSGRGWAMRYFTAMDIYQSPALVVATVRAALSR